MNQTTLTIPGALHQAMREHVAACSPEEACGIIGGRDGYAKLVLTAVNELHSPIAFRMAASDLVKHFSQLEAENLDFIALYHSHPTGPTMPSNQDMREFNYPDVLYLIWSPLDEGWQMKGYSLDRQSFQEIKVKII